MHEGIDSLLRSLQPNPTLPLWMEPGSCLMMGKRLNSVRIRPFTSRTNCDRTGMAETGPFLIFRAPLCIAPCFPRSRETA